MDSPPPPADEPTTPARAQEDQSGFTSVVDGGSKGGVIAEFYMYIEQGEH